MILAGANEISPEMKRYLGASIGWYGIVTEREFREDRCYTVKREQKEIIETHLGTELSIRKGHKGKANLEGIGLSAVSKFSVSAIGSTAELVILYPKSKGNELRLYFKNGVFAPNTGDHVYVYLENGSLSLAVFDPHTVTIISNSIGQRHNFLDREEKLEEELDDFQLIINEGKVPKKVLSQSYAWRRNPNIARSALSRSGFKCELMPEVDVFTSRSTGKPFLEVHHLVPMKQQSRFETSLDIHENLCVLNPLSHRLVHYAIIDELEPHLKTLYNSRRKFLEKIGVSIDDLKAIYQ